MDMDVNVHLHWHCIHEQCSVHSSVEVCSLKELHINIPISKVKDWHYNFNLVYVLNHYRFFIVYFSCTVLLSNFGRVDECQCNGNSKNVNASMVMKNSYSKPTERYSIA
jgi:hypothetical protein